MVPRGLHVTVPHHPQVLPSLQASVTHRPLPRHAPTPFMEVRGTHAFKSKEGKAEPPELKVSQNPKPNLDGLSCLPQCKAVYHKEPERKFPRARACTHTRCDRCDTRGCTWTGVGLKRVLVARVFEISKGFKMWFVLDLCISSCSVSLEFHLRLVHHIASFE